MVPANREKNVGKVDVLEKLCMCRGCYKLLLEQLLEYKHFKSFLKEFVVRLPQTVTSGRGKQEIEGIQR